MKKKQVANSTFRLNSTSVPRESQDFLAAEDIIRTGQQIKYTDENTIIDLKMLEPPPYIFHSHNFFEFDIILSGSGYNSTVHGDERVSRGSVIFQTPKSIHVIKSDEDAPIYILNVEFSGMLEKTILEIFKTFQSCIFTLAENELQYIFAEMLSIFSLPKSMKHYKMLVRNSVEKVIAVAYESYMRSRTVQEQETTPEIYTVLLMIHRDYDKNLKLRDIASSVGYNSDHLGKMLKQITGKSFKEYVNDIRLENAFRMLCSKESNAIKIAESLGYLSYTNFYYAFIKKFGISPSFVLKHSYDEVIAETKKYEAEKKDRNEPVL